MDDVAGLKRCYNFSWSELFEIHPSFCGLSRSLIGFSFQTYFSKSESTLKFPESNSSFFYIEASLFLKGNPVFTGFYRVFMGRQCSLDL